MAIRATPNTTTMPVAMTFAIFWFRAERRSVIMVTAKSSRRRVMADAPMKVSQTTQ